VPIHEPRESHRLVRITRAAVEPTDLIGARPGVTLGRRFVGVVEEDGDPPARVVGSPELSCASCDLCKAGLAPHCRERRTLGLDTDGCLAPYIALPLRNIVTVPPGVDDDVAVLAWTLAESLHAVRLAPEAHYVTVIGEDHRALLTARCARAGSEGVRLLMPTGDLFPVAERWGIRHRLTEEPGRRADQDVVLVASSDAVHLDLALRLVRPRGRVIVQAPSMAHASATLVAENEIELVGARGGSIAGAIRELQRWRIEPNLLVSHRLRFDQFTSAQRLDFDQPLSLIDFE